MHYLLLAVLTIIVYAEVLPTISLAFELLRTWLTAKITILQQQTVYVQEDIQETQERIQPSYTPVIGFQAPNKEEYYDDDEEYEDE